MFFNNWLHESVIYDTFCPQKQKQMIELCRTEGQKLLFEGRYDRVVPAALESLKFSIEVYGLSSIELVPSYLILGEASIGQYPAISLMINVKCQSLSPTTLLLKTMLTQRKITCWLTDVSILKYCFTKFVLFLCVDCYTRIVVKHVSARFPLSPILNLRLQLYMCTCIHACLFLKRVSMTVVYV